MDDTAGCPPVLSNNFRSAAERGFGEYAAGLSCRRQNDVRVALSVPELAYFTHCWRGWNHQPVPLPRRSTGGRRQIVNASPALVKTANGEPTDDFLRKFHAHRLPSAGTGCLMRWYDLRPGWREAQEVLTTRTAKAGLADGGLRTFDINNAVSGLICCGGRFRLRINSGAIELDL